MKQTWVLLGAAGMIATFGVGCAQDKVADNKGNHFNARHRVMGSHIPSPDRGGGTDDTAAQSLDQQQYMQQTERQNARGFGSASGGGAGGR